MSQRLKELLKKYDVPAPRYTSYPTVLSWTENVGAKDYQHSLQSISNIHETNDARATTLSLYFHLPFCENLCHFCGCMQVITKDHSRSREYVNELKKEIEHVAAVIATASEQRSRKQSSSLVGQIHFGGGTPNFLQPEELSEIMNLVREKFEVSPDAEIAIEMHPRTSTTAFCENLATLGFNRISLGVQDLDPRVQKLINRHQTFEMTRDMVQSLRSLGFQHFNMDLVYGLPGQSMEGWQRTLDQVIELKPNRLAVYSYAHVPWVRPVQRTFEDSDLPPPEMKLQLFEKAYEAFTGSDYSLIGMDHFALKDDELSLALKNGSIHRNFMGYSTRADSHQIGFGVSAISYVDGNYFQNQKKLKEYYDCIRSGALATMRGMILSDDDKLRRQIITDIMCRGSVKFDDYGAVIATANEHPSRKQASSFQSFFRDEIAQLDEFIKQDLLVIDDSGIRVINEGSLFLRNIASVFDTYLGEIRSKSNNPTFSKTV